MPLNSLAQVRSALAALEQEYGTEWTDKLAEEVVRLGGDDAVDLMHLALDASLADYEPEDPTEN